MIMTNATITTTGKLTVFTIGDGLVLNLPAQVPGIAVTTETAIGRALEWTTPADIHAELVALWRDAKVFDVAPELVVFHFVAWMAEAGEWSE